VAGLGWTWRLGVVAGIPVRLHWSFGLLVLWIALPAPADTIARPLALAHGLLLLAMLTASVMLHELGHGLMARRLGVGVRDIVLSPIGGMARLEAAVEPAASARIAIALAGPAVNGALATALLPLLWFIGGAFDAGPSALVREWGHHSPAGFVGAAVVGNLALVGLSLLPIVPLDGGQALRAAVERATNRPAAERVMAVIGLAGGAGLAVTGLTLGRWWLIAAAILVALAAAVELTRTERCRAGGPLGGGKERGDAMAGHRTAGLVE
jgi:Zn-dependent protease